MASTGRAVKAPKKTVVRTSPTKKTPATSKKLYTLVVSLARGRFARKGSRPRTIQVLGSHTLEDLHEVIFGAYDREEEHLWEFFVGGKGFKDPANDEYGPPEVEDEDVLDAGKKTIDSLKLMKGDAFGYRFDFGDCWDHAVQVLEVGATDKTRMTPQIIKSVGKSPPQYGDEDDEEE